MPRSLQLLPLLLSLVIPARAYAPPGPRSEPTPHLELPFAPSPFLVTVQTALTLDLYPISRLESNNGLRVDHEPSVRGPFYTALGHLGLKPSTAWGFYQKSKALQMRYPGLDRDSFFEKLQADQAFYNEVASVGFNRMKVHFGLIKAVMAWRWGSGAAEDATDDEVCSDEYVQHYLAMAYPHGYTGRGLTCPTRQNIAER